MCMSADQSLFLMSVRHLASTTWVPVTGPVRLGVLFSTVAPISASVEQDPGMVGSVTSRCRPCRRPPEPVEHGHLSGPRWQIPRLPYWNESSPPGPVNYQTNRGRVRPSEHEPFMSGFGNLPVTPLLSPRPHPHPALLTSDFFLRSPMTTFVGSPPLPRKKNPESRAPNCSGEWSQQQHKHKFITLLLNNPPAGGYPIPRQGPIPKHNN